MKKYGRTCCFFIFLLLCPFYVKAYVPEPELLMELVLESMGTQKKAGFEVRRMFPSSEKETVVVEEKFLLKIPQVFRSEARDGSSFWLADTADDFLFVHGGKRFSDSKPALEDYFYGPMLLRDAGMFSAFLKRRGVDITRTGLDRHEGKICFGIGNSAGSHLLVDKETFLPLFLFLEDQASGFKNRVEIRYRDWHGEEGVFFPGAIDFLDGEGVLLQEIRIGRKDGASFPDSLMDIQALRKRYPLSEEKSRIPRVDPLPSDPMKGVEESLDRFRRRYE